MRMERLSGRKTCDRVQRQGTVWKGTTFVVRWMAGTPRNLPKAPKHPAVYLGTFASAALDKSAVRRNRMRRRCREAFRVAIVSAPALPVCQLLVSPRSASLDAPFPIVQNEVASFLHTLSTWQKKAAPTGSSSSR